MQESKTLSKTELNLRKSLGKMHLDGIFVSNFAVEIQCEENASHGKSNGARDFVAFTEELLSHFNM